MVRRILLLGALGLGAVSSIGCACRPLLHSPCGSSLFPGRRLLAQPVGVPAQSAPIRLVPMGHGGYEAGPAGYGGAAAPGCTDCGHGGGAMPIAASPVGYSHGPSAAPYGQPYYQGSGVPHDSMLLPSPTVIPPGAGQPRIEVDPPKTMAK